MSDPAYLSGNNRNKREPEVHPLVKNSFVFVPTAGMRLAPEVLVLELMREIFFNNFSDEQKERRLVPDRVASGEMAVLHALRGRRKKAGNSKSEDFFAPAYPVLAKGAWLRAREARVINNFLLEGPISRYLWSRGTDVAEKQEEQNAIVRKICQALVGKNSCFHDAEWPRGKEILAVALGQEAFRNAPVLSEEDAINKLKDKTRKGPAMRIEKDELSRRIFNDVRFICELEANLPRLQWIQVLMTFLRFALPAWLLAQMRITDFLHGWLLEAMDTDKTIPGAPQIKQCIAERNRELLRPTRTATRELFECIDGYMKRRIELNILLYCVGEIQPGPLQEKRLCLGAGGDCLEIEELLRIARATAEDIKQTNHFKDIAEDSPSMRAFLTRAGEQFSAWRNPRKYGQGKNIDEFFRVLYKAQSGDEAGGYLLAPEGRGASRGFKVFPGQLLLKTVTFLASRERVSSRQRGGTGRLVLQDVEDHFAEYGVDFSSAVDARPVLMKELQSMGLLTGSPDAGNSVAVACPYG